MAVIIRVVVGTILGSVVASMAISALTKWFPKVFSGNIVVIVNSKEKKDD